MKVLASLRAFLIAIASNPDVQKRAQTELDNVVGTNRLPKFSDANSLPCLTAVVKETLRWHSVAPQGALCEIMRILPHSCNHYSKLSLIVLSKVILTRSINFLLVQ